MENDENVLIIKDIKITSNTVKSILFWNKHFSFFFIINYIVQNQKFFFF